MPKGKNGLSAEFMREPKIRLKCVMSLDCFEEKPTYDMVLWWVRRGFRGHYLEARRDGNHWMTSAEAVRRFLKEIQKR